MNKKTPLPTATTAVSESIRRAPSTESIQLRVTEAEKKDVQTCAKIVNRSVTDYLLACHEAIAAKLREKLK